MELDVEKIREQIKAKQEEANVFSTNAQEQVNAKQQELLNLVKMLQREADRRQGAIDALQALIDGNTDEVSTDSQPDAS